MITNTKIKISALSKDIDIKSKEIINILNQAGYNKNASGSLEIDELSYVFEQLTLLNQIVGFDDYLNRKTYIEEPIKEETPITVDTKKVEDKAEKSSNKNDAKTDSSIVETENKEKNSSTVQNNNNNKSSSNRITGNKKEEVKTNRFENVSPIQNDKTKKDNKAQNNKEKRDNRNNVFSGFQKKTNVESTFTKTSETNSYTGTNNKVIDTRGTSVDLSKYDEKLDNLAENQGKSFDNSNKQKFKKQNKNTFSNKPVNNKTGIDKKKNNAPVVVKQQLTVTIPDEITVGELASRLKVTSAEVVKKLITLGIMANVNQIIDYDTAEYVSTEFGANVKKEIVVTIEDKLFTEEKDNEEDIVSRPPVVCVMGHVDHGKTSILDKIRNTNVTAGEAGGITQAIGAYTVKVKGKDITFLDTPGHEAFTAMRARGAMATDIAILVVAADDGIMPQTIEAINHAKSAGVDIIVAINKMDKQGANPDAVKQALTKYDLIPEEWGGDVICVPVSALTGFGIDDLLENILLVAEMKGLVANPNKMAKGLVIESKLDKGRGPVATLLVQNGTLNIGDVVIAGTSVGKVRAMIDDKGNQIKKAGPSIPVEITGLSEVPESGDSFAVVKDEKLARELCEQRKNKIKQDEFNQNNKVSLDDLFNQISSGVKSLNIIIKADVAGSAEAVRSSLIKLSNDEVKVNVIHDAVGGINEGDVMLATASNAIIVGFNVRPDKNALDLAERQKIDIRTYRIIYECIDEIEAAMKGMLAPKYKESILGHAEVRQTIHISSVGTVAGSYIKDGKVTRNSLIRVLRDGIVIFEDKISSLRRFKDDVREVATGYECGITLERFNDIKEGDVFEAYEMTVI